MLHASFEEVAQGTLIDYFMAYLEHVLEVKALLEYVEHLSGGHVAHVVVRIFYQGLL